MRPVDDTESKEASKRHQLWLNALLQKRSGRRIAPEVQIAVLHALITQRQRLGVERILNRFRTRLRWWKYISWIAVAIRIACLWNIRYYHIGMALRVSQSRNLLLRTLYQGWLTFVLLIFAMLFTEFALMTAFEIQRSTMIAFTYALNFVIVVFIIAAWPFLVGLHAYSYRIVGEIYGFVLLYNLVDFNDVAEMHDQYECCGFFHTNDWTSQYLYRFSTLLANRTIEHKNNFDWVDFCARETNATGCYVPHFCCSVPNCSRMPDGDFATQMRRFVDSPFAAHAFYHSRVPTLPNITGMHQTACFSAISSAVNKDLEVAWRCLLALAIMTVFMMLLVIVVLLYNSGQGQVLSYLSKVRSPRGSPLVWIFLRMDKGESKIDKDLSEFSIIEAIKNFNIDGDVSERSGN